MPDEQNQTPETGPRDETRQRMQRIRVGLTGLGAVILLIVLATALFSRIGGSVNSPGNSAVTAAKPASSDEPLADLGVAPGAPENETTPAKGKH
jgi:hypothetical protein